MSHWHGIAEISAIQHNASSTQPKSIRDVNLYQSGLSNSSAIFIPRARFLRTGHHPTVPKSFKSPSDQSYITFASIPIPNMRFSFFAVVVALTAINSVNAAPALFEERSCRSGTNCIGAACCIQACKNGMCTEGLSG